MIIQQVSAQSEPTFPYNGPFEEPTPSPTTPSGQAVIKLTTDTATLEVGATVTCDIQIESDEEEIDNYSLFLSFDATVLEVVDVNPSQTGVQISSVDTFSTVNTNTADNTAGSINYVAEISGAAQPINRRVAQITFRAKRTGTSVISVNQTQSSITNDSGEDILASSTSLNFTVTGETQDSNGQLPSSGISDTLANVGTVATAILLLYIGVKIVVDKRKGKEIGF